MLMDALKQVKTALMMVIFFSILTGLIYPAVVTVFAQILFPWQANGSLITKNNVVIGSELIGQNFTDIKYFWGRPSATSTYPYQADNSSGSNLGPTNPALIATVQARVDALRKSDPARLDLIPVDLVTASGSGLDPEISPFAAYYQVARVARARHLSQAAVETLVRHAIINRTFGILGEPRVNVLKLNLALDALK